MIEGLDDTINERKSWTNIADILNDEGKRDIKTGTVLGFQQMDGKLKHYKVMKINRKSDHFYVKEMNHLYDQEEIDEMGEQLKKDAKKKPKELESDDKRENPEADSQGE